MPIIPAVGTNAQIDLVYAVASNTFVQRVAPDPINGNLVEIGDSKQPDFYPQLKLMRWRNEVNFSARLVELDASPAIVETAGKVIKYKKASYEAHYYDLGFDDDTGGFEHEIVLKARPTQSVIRWTIQTKGLDFLYQAELTPEEISGGVQRPQDIIGSYAVYHSTASNDFNGGKNYRSGKAFHIKRPKAHDALGNEVWCELNIDPAAGIMTVTIPQGFLDTAVYPVVVDPTFGYETAGASAVPEPYLFANIFAASRYTASTGDVITKITASGVSVSGTDGFGFGVYTFNGTNPVALTGTEQHIVFPTSQAWVDSSALSIGLTNAVQYCLAFGNQDAGTQYVYYDTGVSGDGDVDPTGTALPATFTHDSYTAYKFSIYATYTDGPKLEPIPPGTLRLTGVAPATSRFGGHTAEPIPSATLRLVSVAPAANRFGGHTAEPIPSATLRLAGVVPATSRFGGKTSEPIPSSTLRLVGVAPATSRFGGHTAEPIPSSTLRLVSFAPATSQTSNAVQEPVPSGTLTLVAFAPGTSRFGGHTAEPIPPATLRLVSYNPSFTNPQPAQAQARPSGGFIKKQKPKRAIIDGELIEYYTQEELYWYIQQYLDKLQSELWALESPKEKTKEIKKKIRIIKTQITKAKAKLSPEFLENYEEELLLMLVA